MTTEKHLDYWKIKAAFFETRIVALDARAAMSRVDAKLAALLRAAGFDPDKNYQMDDATETLTEAPPK